MEFPISSSTNAYCCNFYPYDFICHVLAQSQNFLKVCTATVVPDATTYRCCLQFSPPDFFLLPTTTVTHTQQECWLGITFEFRSNLLTNLISEIFLLFYIVQMYVWKISVVAGIFFVSKFYLLDFFMVGKKSYLSYLIFKNNCIYRRSLVNII